MGRNLPTTAIGQYQTMTYYENGKLASRGQWRDGRHEGVQNKYHPNGEVSMRLIYSDKGELLGTEQFNEQGVLIHSDGSMSKKMR
jgi:antitoxin component YwqK of YwqJK toxin-antitoxin module